MTFADLTQVALLGTERQSPPALAGVTPLAQLSAQLDPSRKEQALLSLAALQGLYERAGAVAVCHAAPLPPTCPDEEAPRAGQQAGACLGRMLAGDFVELLPEWLELAARADQLAPPELLPPLLDAAAAKPELREPILAVLGQRGRWLAEQNSAWGWVSGGIAEDETVWQVGDRPARALFLARLRRTQPDRARELLHGTWKEEAPEDRATFLALLASGLGPADEPFLEAALDDKRKEVRRTAAGLLARIPGSGLVRRMLERVQPLLAYTPPEAGSLLKLKKGKAAQIEVTLPAECTKPMLRDGVEPKPPEGMGEKAWWLVQMLGAVPLNHWSETWNLPPAEVLAASQTKEWRKEFFEAWMLAAVRQQHAEWADLLFDLALATKRYPRLGELLPVLPPPRREARLMELLAADLTPKGESLGELALAGTHAWSPELSRAVLAWLRRQTARDTGDWQLRTQLKAYARRLAPEVLPQAAQGWATDSPAWAFWSSGIEGFLEVLHFRVGLHQAFQNPVHPPIDLP